MSSLSPIAAARISSSPINGIMLLEMFKALEVQMKTLRAEGQFAQFQFVDGTELQEGDVIPEIHLSLRTYKGPIISEATEVKTTD